MKYNLNDLMGTLFNTKRMITNSMTTFYCVADKIVQTKSDLIENDMFYKLFVEAWNESINGNDSEMIKLLSDATGKTVTDIQAYSTERVERNVDFKVEDDESTYSIAVPILRSKKPIDDVPFEYVESYIKSFEIRLYKVNAGRTTTYERLSAFPCSGSDATAREVIRYWFATNNN
jgi:hypothetical protein